MSQHLGFQRRYENPFAAVKYMPSTYLYCFADICCHERPWPSRVTRNGVSAPAVFLESSRYLGIWSVNTPGADWCCVGGVRITSRLVLGCVWCHRNNLPQVNAIAECDVM